MHFKNADASPGLDRGGVLNIVRHTIKLKCQYCRSNPLVFSFDISGRSSEFKITKPPFVTPGVTQR